MEMEGGLMDDRENGTEMERDRMSESECRENIKREELREKKTGRNEDRWTVHA